MNHVDHEIMEEKPDNNFPKSIPFIIGNEFCERFSYYGMRGRFFFCFKAYDFTSSNRYFIQKVYLN